MEYMYNRRNRISDEERAGQNIRCIQREDHDFPLKLKDIPGAPRAIYVTGRLPDPKQPSVAVIGARTCSEYGRKMAKWFGTRLGEYGIQVISGMARGIDGISQMAALQSGGTSFGVLGCGVDVCYPKENLELYRMLCERGGLISEYPPGSQPIARQFPARNRIISGLADVLLVIEARQKSGTLITVDMALEQGREVYVVPGRLDDPLSEGCNRLLKQGAGLLLSPEELLQEILNCPVAGTGSEQSENKRKKTKNKFLLDKDEDMVYTSLDLYAKNLEDIVDASKVPVQDVMHILLSLELKGLIREVGKNHYIRL